jgi:hypothetical protein
MHKIKALIQYAGFHVLIQYIKVLIGNTRVHIRFGLEVEVRYNRIAESSAGPNPA